MLRPAVFFQQRRCGDQHACTVAELPHRQIRWIERRRAHAKREIESFFDDIDAAIRHVDVHLHLRMLIAGIG